MPRLPLAVLLLSGLMFLQSCASRDCHDVDEADLLCVAESSNWEATGRHSEVQVFIDNLLACSDKVRLTNMGYSAEGRSMPLLILADPPVTTPAEAKDSGKMVVYAQGGIHSGECCGKEALQILARDIVKDDHADLLKNLIILIAPNYNPDGNERMDPKNRPGQDGPVRGMGIRATAEGYDLNRDNTKLDSPEAQALSRLLNQWDPYLVIDTHSTNGSYHQNTLTFDGPVNPAGDSAIIDFVRHTYLPAVSNSLKQETGYKTTFYGNYNRDKTKWSTYDGRPRFGTRARGIRGIVSILTEAYKYAPYKDRVLCTAYFCEHLLEYASANVQVFRDLVDGVRERTIQAGLNPGRDNKVSVRTKIARLSEDIVLEGWVEKLPEGADPRRTRPAPTSEKKNYTMEHWGAYESVLDVQRPTGYVFPATMRALIKKLRQHGIVVEKWEGEQAVDVGTYTITDVRRARRSYQGHKQVTVDVTARYENRRLDGDLVLVRTAQELGNLVVYLLEPMADDGLVAWNVMDDVLKAGADFPVHRIMSRLQ